MTRKVADSKSTRRTPWARRIISTLILLALVALAVFVVIRLVLWVGNFFKTEHEKATTLSTLQPVSVEACTKDDLVLTLKPAQNSVMEGEGLDVSLSLENKNDEACTVSVGDVAVVLSVGGETIWTPISCSESLAATPLLLSKGTPWEKTLTWDGNVYVGCEVAKWGEAQEDLAAGEGTYDLTSTFLGETPVSQGQIVIN